MRTETITYVTYLGINRKGSGSGKSQNRSGKYRNYYFRRVCCSTPEILFFCDADSRQSEIKKIVVSELTGGCYSGVEFLDVVVFFDEDESVNI
jgi:hypothetical protein